MLYPPVFIFSSLNRLLGFPTLATLTRAILMLRDDFPWQPLHSRRPHLGLYARRIRLGRLAAFAWGCTTAPSPRAARLSPSLGLSACCPHPGLHAREAAGSGTMEGSRSTETANVGMSASSGGSLSIPSAHLSYLMPNLSVRSFNPAWNADTGE
jgi:hypothetical protein